MRYHPLIGDDDALHPRPTPCQTAAAAALAFSGDRVDGGGGGGGRAMPVVVVDNVSAPAGTEGVVSTPEVAPGQELRVPAQPDPEPTPAPDPAQAAEHVAGDAGPTRTPSMGQKPKKRFSFRKPPPERVLPSDETEYKVRACASPRAARLPPPHPPEPATTEAPRQGTGCTPPRPALPGSPPRPRWATSRRPGAGARTYPE